MGRVIYSAIASLDGYIEGPDGRFDWAEPDPEAHAFINEFERPVKTFLFGRRMYETMAVWETDPTLAEHSPEMAEFAALWQAAEKIVYSTTLSEVSTSRTRLERSFDPDAVRELKASAEGDLGISGPDLAAHAFRAGLVDELHHFVVPAIVGGGKPALPSAVRLDLALTEERRLSGGMAFLRYDVRGPQGA